MGFDEGRLEAVLLEFWSEVRQLHWDAAPLSPLVLYVAPEGVRVMRRGELAEHFRANGLTRLCKALEKLALPRTRLAVYVEGDDSIGNIEPAAYFPAPLVREGFMTRGRASIPPLATMLQRYGLGMAGLTKGRCA